MKQAAMVQTDKGLRNSVFTEMVAILVVAATLGISWNHRLIYNAWTGNAPTTQKSMPSGNIPLPLGLMQVRDFQLRGEALLIDARDGEAFAEGHITGAMSIPLGKLDAELQKLLRAVPPELPLVAYCGGYDCHDSATLAARLLQAGYRTVYVYEGGYPEWRDAGYPTAKGGR